MELRRTTFDAETYLPGSDRPSIAHMEVRWDPLTGHTSRLVLGAAARLPPSDYDLAGLAEATRKTCPFCPERVADATPRFVPKVWPEGRISQGETLVFPNLVTYAVHTSVAVYSVQRHYLPLAQMTRQLIEDNLAAQATFLQAASFSQPECEWTAISANHMLPSGSSLFHPHTQATAHPVPTTMQRLLAEVPRGRFEDYLDTERREGQRWLGGGEAVRWVTAFAPLGPAELRAFVPRVGRPDELDADTLAELAAGLSAACGLYDDLGMTSFNLAIYGAPAQVEGYMLNARLVARSAVAPLYRSDATNLERLHWEAAVEVTPERLAEQARARFHRL